jgi:Na+/melibiose symporter-like transporter
MSIGASLVLIAVGAILKYAVTASVSGIDLATVGVILMVVGIIGLAVSLVYLGVLSDRRRGEVVRDRETVRDRDRF